ncbi:hypothetical protein M452_0200635 [Staphylococcus epidermidis APO35]|uniref:hypothetical protein n=3 Tax=Staphylococcus TaxID=1279 RepID=UPI0003C41ABC|nr:hypothetical protein [Staphylococcus epidermidis]ESR04953.1 hypothetical protein M462_0204375 [Staphylococcus epidermidis CIM28]ESR28087.1 hypothetical protein M452_0200635 [Staphylococcus epidermidis APO35]ESU02936.1 hypothetical protein M461_0211530 [Staphylococcus epidermidis CIM37]ESV08995.1 hypothetical protein M456_0211905 [Staphylococcus epidermidis MC28]ESV15231.1 hypothetical protein M463_0201630 [Staphylococcus epidermidis WI05]ESV18970.1 hypothetical protein M464_0203740 [Staphy
MTKKDFKMSNKIINAMKKLEKIIDNPHEKLTPDQYESMSVNIQLSRVKSYISIVVLIMLFLEYIFITVPEIKCKELQGIETIIKIVMLVSIANFIIDFILWIKRKNFL